MFESKALDFNINYLIYDCSKSNTIQLLLLLFPFAYRLPKDTQPGLLRAKDASKKLIDLGLEFTPAEQIIKDAVESLKSMGYV